MEEVVASVFDLMGKTADPHLEEELVRQRVDAMFKVHLFYTGCLGIRCKKESYSSLAKSTYFKSNFVVVVFYSLYSC